MDEILIRQRNIFDPKSTTPYRLSRSKLELFLSCPRCFYLDRRRGVCQPYSPTLSLNIAVDLLLKKEFDTFRRDAQPHPLMTKFGVNAIPFQHPELEAWRDNRRGVQYHHVASNFLLFGAIDDLWEDQGHALHVVDYKATSIDGNPSLDAQWKSQYKRQIEIYTWLFSKNGFPVSNLAYFVYVNADRSREGFNSKLEFSMQIISYKGSTDWIDDALSEARICLERDMPPQSHPQCEWCLYRRSAASQE